MAVPAIDPWTAAFFSAASVAQPGMASSTSISNPNFDSSGWNVNFGGGSIESARAQTPLPTGASTNSVNAYLPMILLGVGGLVLWRLATRKR